MLVVMRRLAARVLTIVIVVCGLVPLTSGASWACFCAIGPLKGAALDRSIARTEPVIYLAEVTAATSTTTRSAYDVLVTESIKGVTLERRSLVSGLGGPDCGVRLEAGARLLVYQDTGGLSSCGGFFAGSPSALERHARIMRASVGVPGTIIIDPFPSLTATATPSVRLSPRAAQSKGSKTPPALWIGVAGLALAGAAVSGVRRWRRPLTRGHRRDSGA